MAKSSGISDEIASKINSLVNELQELHSASGGSADELESALNVMARIGSTSLAAVPSVKELARAFREIKDAFRGLGSEQYNIYRLDEPVKQVVGRLGHYARSIHAGEFQPQIARDSYGQQLLLPAGKPRTFYTSGSGEASTTPPPQPSYTSSSAYAENVRRRAEQEAERARRQSEYRQRQAEEDAAYRRSQRQSQEQSAPRPPDPPEGEQRRQQQQTYPSYADARKAWDEAIRNVGVSELFNNPAIAKLIPGGQFGINSLQRELANAGIGEGSRIVEMGMPVPDLSRGYTQLSGVVANADNVMSRFTVTMKNNGTVLHSTQGRMRTFGDSIVRNVVEFAKWTIAASAVYGVIRTFNQLLQSSIDIQSQLADVQVVMGGSTEQLMMAFESAGRVASRTGSDLMGVIDTYNLAYAAAGAAANPAERLAVAEALLADSMTLATLSGLDQARAFDTLVGALNQMGMSLTTGSHLLDMWVAVSREANVDISTLASTFAIVASASEGAGVSPEKLTAMAAVLAESTKLSADETGNAIRGFISGFQTAGAEAVLSKYGIAVRTATGEMRGFAEIMEQIVSYKQLGILSSAQVGEVTNIVGGGFRRGAQLSAVVENYGRVMDLTDVGMNANGDAADALDIKLDTVKVSLQELTNAFTRLAQALGEDAGFLSNANVVIKVLTGLADATTSLSKGIGGLGPELMLLLAGFGTLKANVALPEFIGSGKRISRLTSGYDSSFAGLGMGLDRALANGPFNRVTTALTPAGRRNDIRPGSMQNLSMASSLAVVGMSSIGALYSDNDGSDISSREGARAVGTIIGGAAGMALTGGSPVGAMLGSSIGSAFVGEVMKDRASIAEAFSSLATRGERETADTEEVTTASDALQERFNDLNTTLSDSIAPILSFGTQLELVDLKLKHWIMGNDDRPIKKNEYLSENELILVRVLKALGLDTGISDEMFDIYGWGSEGGNDRSEEQLQNFYRNLLDENLVKELVTLSPLIDESGSRSILSGSSQDYAVQRYTRQYSTELIPYIEQRRQSSLMDMASGSVSLREYENISDTLTGLPQKVANFQAALAQTSLGELDPVTLADMFLNLPPEISEQLTVLITEINSKASQLEIGGDLDPETEALLRKSLDEAIAFVEDTLPPLAIRAQMESIQPLQMVDVSGLTQAQLDTAIEQAERNTDVLIDAQLALRGDLTEEEREALRQAIKDEYEETWISFYKNGDLNIAGFVPKGVDPNMLRSAISSVTSGDSGTPTGILDWSDKLSSDQMDFFMSYYSRAVGAMQSNGMPVQEDNYVAVLSDALTPITINQTLANMILQDIYDVNKQQLEGIFNIPDDVTAMIPYTGQLPFGNSGGGGGSSGLDIDPNNPLFAYEPQEALGGANSNETIVVPYQEALSVKDGVGNWVNYLDTPTQEYQYAGPGRWVPMETPTSQYQYAGPGRWVPMETPTSHEKDPDRSQQQNIQWNRLYDFGNIDFTQRDGNTVISNILDTLGNLIIPFTLKLDLTNQMFTMLDGALIAENMESRQLSSFKEASRSHSSGFGMQIQ